MRAWRCLHGGNFSANVSAWLPGRRPPTHALTRTPTRTPPAPRCPPTHALTRIGALSSNRDVVLLDGDVIEHGGICWQVRLDARWRMWRDERVRQPGSRWPATVALAACLGVAPAVRAASPRAREPATQPRDTVPAQASKAREASSLVETSTTPTTDTTLGLEGTVVVEARPPQQSPRDLVLRAVLKSEHVSLLEAELTSTNGTFSIEHVGAGAMTDPRRCKGRFELQASHAAGATPCA
jgi:hypothetical protein